MHKKMMQAPFHLEHHIYTYSQHEFPLTPWQLPEKDSWEKVKEEYGERERELRKCDKKIYPFHYPYKIWYHPGKTFSSLMNKNLQIERYLKFQSPAQWPS